MPPRRLGTDPAGFHRVGLSQIVATTMAVMTASRRVLEEAGLKWARTVYLDWQIRCQERSTATLNTSWAADQPPE
jgi:hypothetical protein